jgi:fermentation-respiration switch protein FrsA (DUF1100 family)
MASPLRSLEMLMTLAAVAAVVYLALAGFMYLAQHSLLYLPGLPGREQVATPEDIGLPYQTLRIPTSDAESLHAWFVPASRAEGTLLFFHGNAGNISHRLDSIALFHDLGLNVLILDYRGYGLSTGKPSEQGTYLDARAAWEYLTAERALQPGSIVVFGRSLGGAVASWLAARVEPGGLVLESTFTSVPDLGAQLYPWLPVRLLSRLRYDSRTNLARVHAPVLVIHSRDDEIIPVRHGRELFAAANEPKSFLELRGGHNDGFLVSRDRYLGGLRRFLEQNLGL